MLGVGMCVALAHTWLILGLMRVVQNVPTPIGLLILVVPLLIGAAWFSLVSMAVGRLSRVLLLQVACLLAAGFLYSWAIPLAEDDGGMSLRNRDKLMVSVAGPIVISGAVWFLMAPLVLLVRGILGRPRPWTPDACPACLYDLSDDKLHRCPECGTEPVESSIALSSPARWVDASRKARWYLVALPLVVCLAWTAQQMVTRTLAVLRYEAASDGTKVNAHEAVRIAWPATLNSEFGVPLSGTIEHDPDESSLRSVLYRNKSGLQICLFLRGENSLPAAGRPIRTNDWVAAWLTPEQTASVLSKQDLPRQLLEAMHEELLRLQEGGQSDRWIDPAPYFTSD